MVMGRQLQPEFTSRYFTGVFVSFLPQGHDCPHTVTVSDVAVDDGSRGICGMHDLFCIDGHKDAFLLFHMLHELRGRSERIDLHSVK